MSTTSAFASFQPSAWIRLPGLGEQLERVGAGEPRIVGRKERADVLEPGGTEQRVGERVREHISVGVAGKPARVLDRHAAEHERHAVLERVRVEAGTDAVLRHARSPREAPRETGA